MDILRVIKMKKKILLLILAFVCIGLVVAPVTAISLTTVKNTTHMTYIYSGSGTTSWTAPYSTTASVHIVSGSGGGGGGGGHRVAHSIVLGGGGGGGGSGWINTTTPSITSGSSYTITVGNGGSGGAGGTTDHVGGSSGSSGGSSVFDSSTVVGGSGGIAGTNGGDCSYGLRGAGGAGDNYGSAGSGGVSGGIGGAGGIKIFTYSGTDYTVGGDGANAVHGNVGGIIGDSGDNGNTGIVIVTVPYIFTGTAAAEESIPTIHYVTLQDTITLDDNVTLLSTPPVGDYIIAATSSDINKIPITGSGTGFGVVIDTTPTTAGTTYSLATSNAASYYVEGRGIATNIFKSDGVAVGEYNSGGAINSVDIAASTGLLTITGSQDQKYYVFSKDAASGWYLFYSGTVYDVVNAVKMSLTGDYFAVGYDDGRTRLYETVNTTVDVVAADTFSATGSLYIDGVKGVGKTIEIYESQVTYPEYEWVLNSYTTTDSNGRFIFQIIDGYSYKITATEYDHTKIFSDITQNNPYVTLTVTTSQARYNYTCNAVIVYDAIVYTYTDGENADVTVRVYNINSDTDVKTETYSATMSVNDTYHLPPYDTSAYKIVFDIYRTNGDHMIIEKFVSAYNLDIFGWTYEDDMFKNILGVLFLMVVGGLFSWMNSNKGIVLIGFLAFMLRYFNVITLDYSVIMLAVFIGVVTSLIRGSKT